MSEMRAYHGDPAEKSAILAQLAHHRLADELVKGIYWENGKGCAVGCTLHSGDHMEYEARFGIPVMLARLEDVIFEGLPNNTAKLWPERFMTAIAPGADLSRVGWRFLEWLLTDESVNPGITHPLVRDAVKQCVDLIAPLAAATDTMAASAENAWSAANVAWSAARSAARSAERSAAASAESAANVAWSAARSAVASAESAAASAARSTVASAASAAWSAESAARSAAWSAESTVASAENAANAARNAARSAARSAAESAVWSAESAARSAVWSAAWKKMADQLIALISSMQAGETGR